jgi:hypothetical protein
MSEDAAVFVFYCAFDVLCVSCWIIQLLGNQCVEVQGDQKVSVHLMITIQKVTSNVQRVPRQSTDI